MSRLQDSRLVVLFGLQQAVQEAEQHRSIARPVDSLNTTTIVLLQPLIDPRLLRLSTRSASRRAGLLRDIYGWLHLVAYALQTQGAKRAKGPRRSGPPD